MFETLKTSNLANYVAEMEYKDGIHRSKVA